MGAPALRTDIQALRALAVTVVVLFHLDLEWFRGGFIGVDVFFVISGYLVLGSELKKLIARDRDEGETQAVGSDTEPPSAVQWFLLFLTRRIQRLTPAATVCLLFTMLLLVYAPQPVDDWDNVRAAALHYVNVHFYLGLQSYWQRDSSRSFVLHFWSLALEEQFYVVVGLIIVLVKSVFGSAAAFRKRTVVCATGLLLALCFMPMFSGSADARFFLLPFRMWEFVAGALVSLLGDQLSSRLGNLQLRCFGMHSSIRSFVFAVLVIVLTFCSSYMPRPDWPHFGAVFVVIVTMAALSCGVDIPFQLPVAIGDWSYSIYLYHWPLISWALLLPWPESPFSLWFRNSSVLALAFCFALCSFTCVETGTRGLWRENRKVWLSLFIVLSCAVAGASVGLVSHSSSLMIVEGVEHSSHGWWQHDRALVAEPPLNFSRTADNRTVHDLSTRGNSCRRPPLEFEPLGAPPGSFSPPTNCNSSLRQMYEFWNSAPRLHPKWDRPRRIVQGDASHCIVLVGNSHARDIDPSVEMLSEMLNATFIRHYGWFPGLNLRCLPKLDRCEGDTVFVFRTSNNLGNSWNQTKAVRLRNSIFNQLLDLSSRGHVLWVGDNPSRTICRVRHGITNYDMAIRPSFKPEICAPPVKLDECISFMEDHIPALKDVTYIPTLPFFCGGEWSQFQDLPQSWLDVQRFAKIPTAFCDRQCTFEELGDTNHLNPPTNNPWTGFYARFVNSLAHILSMAPAFSDAYHQKRLRDWQEKIRILPKTETESLRARRER